MRYELHLGDCRDVMATLPAESVDAIVCDPPYGLSFMGKGWDHGVPGVDFWVEALRVLKPGGHLIAFGGTRTYHRLAVAIEDAGFEVRDCLMYLYGSGFPKSLDVSKAMDKQAGAERKKRWKAVTPHGMTGALEHRPWIERAQRDGGIFVDGEEPSTDLAKQWQGWGTALKPAVEPAILARKPLTGTVADNVAQWGTGALNIDGCRVGTSRPETSLHAFTALRRMENRTDLQTPTADNRTDVGRWPANLILDEDAAAALDAQSGGASRFF